MSDVQELKLLLPFYVNGTLNAQDCAAVDQGLAVSAELRRELDELNALAQTVREGGQAMTAKESDADVQLEKLMNDPHMAAVAKDDQTAPLTAMQTSPTPNGMLSFLNPKNWHPAVSLALAAAAVAQAGLYIGERQESGQQIAKLEKRVGDLEYQLASGPGGGAGQADILVQIKPDTSWAALSELLATEGLSIVDGPSDNSLSLSSELDGAALDALIVRLRASGLIETADKAA
jgi:hypothetical protein